MGGIKECYFHDKAYFLITLFRVKILSVAFLAVANLVRLGMPVRCQVSARSQYLVRFGLQGVLQSTHLTKNCYPKMISNEHLTAIVPPRQLDYRCMHPAAPNFSWDWIEYHFARNINHAKIPVPFKTQPRFRVHKWFT